jgi:hypothetical protein
LEAVPENLREAPLLPTDQNYDPAKAYALHRQAMLKMVPDAEPSRLDAYIALQMREKGFTREVIMETLLQCAPEAQPDQTRMCGIGTATPNAPQRMPSAWPGI